MLEWTFYANTVRSWILALLVALLVIAVLRLILPLVQRQLARLSERTSTSVDDILRSALAATRGWFIVVLGLWAGSLLLLLPEKLTELLSGLVVLGTLIQIGIWGTTAIRGYVSVQAMQKVDIDAASVTTIRAVGFLVSIGLWIVLFLMALANFGIDVTALIAGLGVGGIAIALAVQNVLGDLFASLSIVLDKPFVYGDFIVVDNLSGTVEHVGLKTTRVRSLSGEQLVFSNSDLLKSRVRNYKRMSQRRIVFGVGVTYQTPRTLLEQIPTMLREAVEAQPDTTMDRAHLKGFGPSSIDYEIVYFVESPEYGVYMDRQQAINLEIVRRFEEAGVEFAYPTQTLFINHENAQPT